MISDVLSRIVNHGICRISGTYTKSQRSIFLEQFIKQLSEKIDTHQQGQYEVCVEADEQNQESDDEVIHCSRFWHWSHNARENVNHGGEYSTEILQMRNVISFTCLRDIGKHLSCIYTRNSIFREN